jgi:chromosome segregation ATPase
MVQKPPVDIEWYDDGFSMEEQLELKKAYLKKKAMNRPKIEISEEYHEKTKDKIISDLRQKLAADEEYIKELEEGNVLNDKVLELEKQLESEKQRTKALKENLTNLNNKYVALLENPELGVQKYRDTIKDLENTIDHLKKVRDELIGKLNNV